MPVRKISARSLASSSVEPLNYMNVRILIYIYIFFLSFLLPPCSAFSEILFPRESSTFEDAGRRETKENKERARLGIRHSSRVGGAGGARARPTHGHTYIHRLPSILGEFTKALVARLIVTGLVSISRTYVARVQLDVG